MKKDNSAKSLPVKASKYPTKRTVNLAQRESHSRSTLTLTLGLVLIVVLSFCVANFGVLRQLEAGVLHDFITFVLRIVGDHADVGGDDISPQLFCKLQNPLGAFDVFLIVLRIEKSVAQVAADR